MGKKYVDFCGIVWPARQAASTSRMRGERSRKAAAAPPRSTAASACAVVVGVGQQAVLAGPRAVDAEHVAEQEAVEDADVEMADRRVHVGEHAVDRAAVALAQVQEAGAVGAVQAEASPERVSRVQPREHLAGGHRLDLEVRLDPRAASPAGSAPRQTRWVGQDRPGPGRPSSTDT